MSIQSMTQEDSYKTRDIGEAGALILEKQRLITIERREKICWFVFEDKNTCRELSNKYFFGNLLVSAREYKETLDRLKNRIFARN